tara:strand:- start:9262 stop:9780 length:519 start_codon:yes stop_codon:yes gene_type:complete
MDHVNNNILKYLTNPIYQSSKNITENNDINEDDKLFYKKRILSMGKDIYSGTYIDNNLNKTYNDFIALAINYCKELDKKDILQEEYNMLNTNTKQTKLLHDNSFNIHETNNIIFNGNTPDVNTLDKFITIKSNTSNESKFIPKKREINLKQHKLKKKGLNNKEKKKKKDKIS